MSYEDERCKQEGILAKHIAAVLKVGKENGMTREDILIHLECHVPPLPFKIEEFIFRGALWQTRKYHVRDTFGLSGNTLYYLRKAGEEEGWDFDP